MTDTTIHCPRCGFEFPLSAALTARLRADAEAATGAAHAEDVRRAVIDAEVRTAAQHSRERAFLESQIAEQRQRLALAQESELELRKRALDLETRQRELDLEVARRLDAGKQRLAEEIRRAEAEQHGLKLKERERQIDELKHLLEEARRKSEQGSQERQGEVLEIDIEAALRAAFPQDSIQTVPRGAAGADLLQVVRDPAVNACGSLLWELKNTKRWQPAWVAKLKHDQRACGASLAILVSVAVPDEAQGGIARIDGVWVASLAAWPALATALREQLIQVSFARNAASGMSDKMTVIYEYLAGEPFRHKVEAIVEAFIALRGQLDKERRAMSRQWAEREKQLERVIASTAGMYGDLRGTIGQAMQPIAALELDAGEPPDDAAGLPKRLVEIVES
jgi:hypothetical protein